MVALVTIPWMLLVNPYLLWKEEMERQKARAQNGGDFELSSFASSKYEVFNEEKVTLLATEKTHFVRHFVMKQV